MRYTKLKRIITLVLLLAVVGFAFPSVPTAQADENPQAPDLPSPICDSVRVPAGNQVAFHTYALGVQIYRWNGISWDFVAPEANLFADANYRGKVGSHYGGPTWESNSGSNVVGRRVAGCTPDTTAIPWLRLEAVSTAGPGIFDGVTFIQRVNTTGGIAPTTPGSAIGAEARVLYTTEYYFYRASN
jgi:hypothetical protein